MERDESAAAAQPDAEIVALRAEVAQLREALQAGEARYRQITETTQEGIWIIDAETRLTYVNRRLAEMLGYGVAEMLGRSSFDFIYAEDRELGRTLLERRRDGVSGVAEIRLKRKDGTALWITSRSQPFIADDGTFMGALAMLTDTSNARDAEAARHENEERYHRLADALPQIVWVTDANGTTTYVNRRWLDFTGLTPEQTRTNDANNIAIHPDDLANLLERFNTSLRTGEPYEVEGRLLRRDGVYRWHLIRALPIKNTAGNVSAWFGTSTDIHDRREMEDAQRELSRFKDTFLSIAGHELRTPLTTLKGYTQMIRRDIQRRLDMGDSTSVKQVGMLDKMSSQIERMTRLTGELLDTSRIQSRQMQVEIVPEVDVTALVQRVVEQQRMAAPNRMIMMDVPSEAVSAALDAERIEQVVNNLVSNAIKYSGADKPVTVTLACSPDSLRVVVRDEGYGIAPDALPHIFDPFYRIRESRNARVDGLGLGLYISAEIVRTHGGSLTVDSTPGIGSTFTVTLPRVD